MTTDDTRRRRALYRAQHRGTKEMDFLLGRYAQAQLGEMSPTNLTAFEELLSLPDPDLQKWLMVGDGYEGSALAGFLTDIRAFHGLSNNMASQTNSRILKQE